MGVLSPKRKVYSNSGNEMANTALPLIMRYLKVIRLILTFYSSFFLATALITVCCISISWRWGISTFTPVFWFKLITLAIVYYFIRTYKSKEFYYYQNLGVSKTVLWTSTLAVDLIIFLLSMLTTYKLR
jgi:hypothetical protein